MPKVIQLKKFENTGQSSITGTFDALTEGSLLICVHGTGANHSSGAIDSGWNVLDPATNPTEIDEIRLSWKKAGASESTSVTANPLNSSYVPINGQSILFLMEVEGPWPDSDIIDIEYVGSRTTGLTYNINPGVSNTTDIQFAVAAIWQRYQSSFTNNQWDKGWQQFGGGIAISDSKGGCIAFRETRNIGDITDTTVQLFGNSGEPTIGLMVSFKADSSVVGPPTYSDGNWEERARPADGRELNSVDPDPTGAADYDGSSSFEGLINAYNGGFLRQKADNSACELWISRSGGHFDYYNTADFRLNLLDLDAGWEMIGTPTPDFAAMDLDITSTAFDSLGNLKAAHTYSLPAYDRDNDTSVHFGSRFVSVISPTPPFTSREVGHKELGTSLTAWIHSWADVPDGNGDPYHARYIGNGKFIIAESFDSGSVTGFHIYDRNTSSYTTYPVTGLSNAGPWGTSCWDSKRDKLVMAGTNANEIYMYSPNLIGGEIITVPTPPTGLDISLYNIGLAYDTYLDKYAFWQGGTDIFYLDPVNFTWETRTMPAQTVTPTDPNSNGTYGRFQYIEPISGLWPEGAYVVVNAVDESTYLFAVPAPNNDISGSADINAVLSGNLVGIGNLSGSAGIDASLSGSLNGRGALVGYTNINAILSANIEGIGSLSGSSLFESVLSGLLTGNGALSGSAEISSILSGILSGYGNISGTSDISIINSGLLNGIGQLTGSVEIDLNLSGLIYGLGVALISGSANLDANLSGQLSGIGALAGSANIVISNSGNLIGLVGISGSTGIFIALSGQLEGRGNLAGNADIGAALTGTLVGEGALSGAIIIEVDASGNLTNLGAIVPTPETIEWDASNTSSVEFSAESTNILNFDASAVGA